jgi:hypothetical protein
MLSINGRHLTCSATRAVRDASRVSTMHSDLAHRPALSYISKTRPPAFLRSLEVNIHWHISRDLPEEPFSLRS